MNLFVHVQTNLFSNITIRIRINIVVVVFFTLFKQGDCVSLYKPLILNIKIQSIM